MLTDIGRLPSRMRLQLYEATGFENQAKAAVEGLGETLIETQYRQGAAMRGIEFASVSGAGRDAQLFLNEVKNAAGAVPPESFTALGMGRGGAGVLHQNLRVVMQQIRAANLDPLTRATLLRQLRNGGAQIRVIGSAAKGTVFTTESMDLIGSETGFAVTQGMRL